MSIERQQLNNRVLLLEAKLKNIWWGDSILGDATTHKQILLDGIAKLKESIFNKDYNLKELFRVLSTLEEYYTLLDKTYT
jgi:hypothetical protein